MGITLNNISFILQQGSFTLNDFSISSSGSGVYPYSIVTGGLVFNADALYASSYPGSGNTWYDVSGNNNTGTLINGPTYVPVSSSILFDGTNDYATFGSGSSINDLGPATFIVWLNWTASSAISASSILYKSDNNVSAGWWLSIDPGYGGIGFAVPQASSNMRYYLSSSQTPARNTWYMLAVTWDGTTLVPTSAVKIYLNGIQNTTTPTTSTGFGAATSDATWQMDLGNSRTGSPWYFGGYMSAVQIYNRVLTAAEILQNYNALRSRFIVQSGLIMYLDASLSASYSGSGTKWTDLSGNGNHGTINGTFTYQSQSINFPLGNNVYVDCGSGSTLNNLPSASFSVIIKPNSYLSKALIHKTLTDTGDGWWYSLKGGIGAESFGFEKTTTSTNMFEYSSITTPPYNTGSFNMLTFTWNGTLSNTSVKLYWNGSEVASYSSISTGTGTTISDASIPLRLGYYNAVGPQDWFVGHMGAVIGYNRVLSATEVLQNYNALKATYSLP